jgi:hypothetical protein
MSLRSAGLGLRPKAHGAARRFICTLQFNRGIGLLLKLACTLAFRHPPGSWSGFVVDNLALSARVGNIADNCAGGLYGHRAAKTTLNRVIRTTMMADHQSRPGALSRLI